ncbi:MAG: hypothetical protein PHR65_06050 [Syntrophomonadaceae bacterium]|nr:hypothetical protein [Syntrophomonadaceae bacterium]
MKKSKVIILFLSAFLILGLLFLPACSQKESKPQKPKESSGQKPEAPPETEKLLKDLDKIIQELDKMIKAQKMPSFQQKEGESSSASSGQKQKDGSSQEGSQKEESASSSKQGGSKQQESASSSKNPWPSINQGVKSIHQNWNQLEPEAVRAGLPVSSRDHWEKTLSSLTMAASKKNAEESLMATISLYQPFADIAQVFAMTLPPDFFRVKYEVMAAMQESMRQDWEKAALHIPKMQENWESLKVQAKDADPRLISCCEFALRDLEDAIKNQEMELVLIKGEISLDNLKKLEEKLKKAMTKGKS